MSTKTYEKKALHQIELALTHATLAVEELRKAGASCDDFPTARHEIEEMADKAENIKKDLENLRSELDLKKNR